MHKKFKGVCRAHLLAVYTVVLAMLVALAWQHRITLLVFIMPTILSVTKPVSTNKPVNWTRGPRLPTDSYKHQRPPNIILIVADGWDK